MAIRRDFVWILYLNDMRTSHIETCQVLARAETKEALVRYVKQETVAAYNETIQSYTWGKVFRKDGPLEWYNPPYPGEMETSGETDHFLHCARVIDYSDEIDRILEVK
jgi:hypothetical protein